MDTTDRTTRGRRSRYARGLAIALLAGCAAVAAAAEAEPGSPAAPASEAAVPAAPAPEAAPPGSGTLGEHLPPPFVEIGFLGLALWQWIGLVVLAPAAWIVACAVVGLAVRLVRPIVARTETQLDDQLIRIMRPPARVLVWLGCAAVGNVFLALPPPARVFLGGVERALVIVALTWFGVRAVDVCAAVIRERLEARGRWSAVAVLPLGSRAVKAALFVVAFVSSLQNLGLDVTGLIAGLSIGGLAVGLAAQKSIANLFGGVSLAVDQPVRVGDFCRFGEGRAGTIEEIGLRSTRVRTDERTLVTVPNAEFSEIQLENFAARDKFRLQCVIPLRYETRPDQLRQLMAELRRQLMLHPMVEHDLARVRLVALGANGPEVEVFAYVKTAAPAEFLEVREDIFLQFLEIVEASGSAFAHPTRTLFVGRDRGVKR